MHVFDTVPTVFLDAQTVRPNELDISCLKHCAEPLTFYAHTQPHELLARTEGATCIITNKVEVSADFFAARPEVRLVCVIATGTNNVDLEAAQAHGVCVVNCRGYCTQSVAQHAIMLILMLLRSAPSYQKQVQQGDWSQSSLFCLLNDSIVETCGLTLGIVGYGDIGRAVRTLAEAFGLRVLISERVGQTPRAGRVAFDQVIEQADVLTLHCPLTDDTRGMINAERLSAMKDSAVLINTARGALIDEHALAAALRAHTIAGAALDVLTHEPPEANHPLLTGIVPNLILTPHNAWASRQARQVAIDQTAENIATWREGRTVRQVV
ncbi:D-2-hydroxyacid dehydrogenase [Gilvimarinus sp. 1_MG-2023]|uniref:D-2-hydroxyacid dehydrogenase n=1 Tax=Gilvimarinus sp. 1_MG-2023 TaxID=3062638 RepID=UPI0026E41E1C|nr:D-2-hydroxyacid dehydrogenase [Gilvimarinus sp. 1_MG-2023]MDO6746225.1 D-2-hydroxyacid dehydrogenase [Gilvimarinus sp. 1_MG-2023]